MFIEWFLFSAFDGIVNKSQITVISQNWLIYNKFTVQWSLIVFNVNYLCRMDVNGRSINDLESSDSPNSIWSQINQVTEIYVSDKVTGKEIFLKKGNFTRSSLCDPPYCFF